MELRTYLKILVRKWWIIAPIFVVTFSATYIFTINQEAEYESSATFVMRPRTTTTEVVDEEGFVRAVDTLSRRVEINTTYTEVAKSNLIKRRAIDRLELTSDERRGLSVNSKVIAGTNVLEITVTGPDPELTKAFADAVGIETRNYISSLYDIFALEPLDEARVPRNPVNSNTTLNLMVGAVLGLILGVGVALLVEYLAGGGQGPTIFNIIDFESGAYNEAYLRLRLKEEMTRARRTSHTFSLALLKVSHPGMINGSASQTPHTVWRGITSLVAVHLPEDHLLTRYGDNAYAVLLPDTNGSAARLLLQELRLKVETTPLEVTGLDSRLLLQVAAGIAAFENYQIGLDELLAQAGYALSSIESTAFGGVSLFSAGKNDEAGYQTISNWAT